MLPVPEGWLPHTVAAHLLPPYSTAVEHDQVAQTAGRTLSTEKGVTTEVHYSLSGTLWPN